MSRQLAVVWTCALGVVFGALAQQTPAFQVSLTPDCARYDRDQRIEGVTLSVWGENPQTALSIGLVNGSAGESAGLTLGLMNYAESYSGAQWGLANFAGQDCYGWQGGPLFGLVGSVVNYTGGHMGGVQTGLVNLSGKLSGLQVGLINYTQYADRGLQIGVVNLIAQNSGWFDHWPDEVAPGMILVNWHFE